MKYKKLILVGIIVLASLLRLWGLDKIPVSLFGDELDVGYHAYSILKTGKDYSGNFLPIHFHSLAEWRTPLYLYSAIPTVAIFGITPLGVRLPAAVFGILGVLALYLLINQLTSNLPAQTGKSLALTAAGVLAISPWHIQYSRAGFEATLLLLLLLLGLYFFFVATKNHPDGKYLWLSMLCFALTPWVYSTAKLFTPLLLIFLFLIWKKEILKISARYLLFAVASLLIVGGPIAVSTIFGGGAQRFGYISVFTDPTTESEVGSARQNDARARGETGTGLKPTLIDRVIHNKFTYWGETVVKNYFQAFSTDFLFIKGDLNLRHSIGIGEFYKVEFLALILGLILFFSRYKDARTKWLIIFWILAGVIPAAITREGGRHATRLILILPPLVFLISYGLLETYSILKNRSRKLFAVGYLMAYLINFGLYQHQYWAHYPWESERWWHSGFRDGIASIKAIDKDYDKVAISTASEPPWIFFAAWYEYSPDKWQKEFPIGNDVDLAGFGRVSHIDKFYFGSPRGGLYDWGQVLDKKTLYLASEKEVKVNLIMEPERTPGDLKLIKAISYPSGEPAFYLFTKK